MEAIVEAAEASGDIERLKRQRQFAWYWNPPPTDQTDGFFLGAFWELSSCRSIGMSIGPIPWTAIKDYGHHHQLEPDVLNAFIQITRALDARYLKWVADETPKPDPGGKR